MCVCFTQPTTVCFFHEEVISTLIKPPSADVSETFSCVPKLDPRAQPGRTRGIFHVLRMSGGGELSIGQQCPSVVS